MKKLDCRGLACPKPVIMTKKELEATNESVIEVIVDNEAALENVSKFAQNSGCKIDVKSEQGIHTILINRGVATENVVECEKTSWEDIKKITILISTDKLGVGDDRLGAALMKSYFYALSESESKPSTLLFLNSGVKLTTEGSDIIESLKLLENTGTSIFSCGTCLDFYELKEKLLIGSVTNMYTIIEKMNEATNTIKL
jgi:selenium metabolism protein YedF